MAAAFVGREHELAALHRLVDSLQAGGSHVAMIAGEPGIGKTALGRQIASYAAAQGFLSLIGHCYQRPGFSLPYQPFVEVLSTVVRERGWQTLADLMGPARLEIGRIVPELRWHLDVDAEHPDDPDAARWRLFQAVTGLLSDLSSEQGLLLILEDLHWADDDTLDLLQHFVRGLESSRIVLIGTYRNTELDRAPKFDSVLAELRRSSDVLRLSLSGLSVAEVHALDQSVQEELAEFSTAISVHQLTEGNPLFVHEILRFLHETGRRGPAGTDILDPETDTLPDGIREVIRLRLGMLSPECGTMLTAASVIGEEFDLALLHQASGMEEASLERSLDEARRAAIIEEKLLPDGVRYRFTHVLYHHALYAEMSGTERIRQHQSAAHAMEALYASRAVEHAATLATLAMNPTSGALWITSKSRPGERRKPSPSARRSGFTIAAWNSRQSCRSAARRKSTCFSLRDRPFWRPRTVAGSFAGLRQERYGSPRPSAMSDALSRRPPSFYKPPGHRGRPMPGWKRPNDTWGPIL
jgi:predicted ATPase